MNHIQWNVNVHNHSKEKKWLITCTVTVVLLCVLHICIPQPSHLLHYFKYSLAGHVKKQRWRWWPTPFILSAPCISIEGAHLSRANAVGKSLQLECIGLAFNYYPPFSLLNLEAQRTVLRCMLASSQFRKFVVKETPLLTPRKPSKVWFELTHAIWSMKGRWPAGHFRRGAHLIPKSLHCLKGQQGTCTVTKKDEHSKWLFIINGFVANFLLLFLIYLTGGAERSMVYWLSEHLGR